MLFSNDQIAEQINGSFEPVWVSVRDVPIVRIDFGGGNVLTRTLHGNIATCVCTADGTVLDVMPGVYEPATYAKRLAQFALLHRYVLQDAVPRNAPGGDAATRLRTYHETQAAALARGEPAHVFGAEIRRTSRVADFSKTRRIEAPLKLVLRPPGGAAGDVAPATSEDSLPARPTSASGRSLWGWLAEDTRVNETTRRRAIHEHLAAAGRVMPDDITRWLYREVLHADLDDPYLGLGETLFATYPFREEDEQ